MSARRERFFLALLLLTFLVFTWRGLLFFYSGDDMMNLWKAWTMNPWRLGRALVLPWEPVYRPLGGAIYRAIYKAFGFHPLPLYTFCYLLLIVNFLLAWRFFRALALPAGPALTALALTFVHGRFLDLYISAGTIYDRLAFLFTVTAICVYARARGSEGGLTLARGILIWVLCLAAMDSKESGVTAPVLLLLYELVFITRKRGWLRELLPLALALGGLSAAFVFGRVRHTPDLLLTPDYQTKFAPGVWMEHVGSYLSMLTYDHIQFSAETAVALLLTMLVISLFAPGSNRRTMLFGWFFFVLAILPVATIAPRLAYVLYVPILGLGAWLAAGIDWALGGRWRQAALVTMALGSIGFHTWNRVPFGDPQSNPEARLTEQFRREYPVMRPFTKLLFASDYFPPDSFDLRFNLELLYGIPLEVRRLQAPPDQQPDPRHPVAYDHIFAAEDLHYVELDNRNPEESVRLHILRHYATGRHLSTVNRDRGAYVVSGILDSGGSPAGCWTRQKAQLKFDVYPADSILSVRYYVTDEAIAPGNALQVAVNGHPAGSAPMVEKGMHQATFRVPASWIINAGSGTSGYTLVDLAVDHPIPDGGGGLLGVVLSTVDFDYAQGAGRQ